MNEPTTAEILEAHNALQNDKERFGAACGCPRWEEAHRDRGILLKRLEAAEKEKHPHSHLKYYIEWRAAEQTIKQVRASADSINPVALTGKPSYSVENERLFKIKHDIQALIGDSNE